MQAIKDAATDADKAALDAAKGFLGIESPSKEFAKLGNFMMQGMAIGITGNQRLPVRAAVGAASETMRNVYNTFNLTAQYGAKALPRWRRTCRCWRCCMEAKRRR